MSGQTFGIIFGGVIAVLGIAHIAYAVVVRLRSAGFWSAGRNVFLEAEKDSDPVGFKTVLWGNIASGVFMVAIGAYVVLTSH